RHRVLYLTGVCLPQSQTCCLSSASNSLLSLWLFGFFLCLLLSTNRRLSAMLSSSDGVVVVVRDSHQKRIRDVMVTVVACDGLVVMGKNFTEETPTQLVVILGTQWNRYLGLLWSKDKEVDKLNSQSTIPTLAKAAKWSTCLPKKMGTQQAVSQTQRK
ncbi:hypothetical protein M8C21_002188, partial [Ambrosia artemisiifolia]